MGGNARDEDSGWVSLGVGAKELRLENTLPTGQSFRWRETTEGDYVGVIGERVVSMRQAPDDVLYRVHAALPHPPPPRTPPRSRTTSTSR